METILLSEKNKHIQHTLEKKTNEAVINEILNTTKNIYTEPNKNNNQPTKTKNPPKSTHTFQKF